MCAWRTFYFWVDGTALSNFMVRLKQTCKLRQFYYSYTFSFHEPFICARFDVMISERSNYRPHNKYIKIIRVLLKGKEWKGKENWWGGKEPLMFKVLFWSPNVSRFLSFSFFFVIFHVHRAKDLEILINLYTTQQL